MSTVGIADIGASLQKVILPYVRDNFTKETPLLDQIKRNENVTFMNNQFFAPIRSSRSGGVSNLATDKSNVNAAGDTTTQATVDVKIMTGAFNISKLVIDATRDNKGAVENELTRQADSLVNDFAKSANRQYYSDGYGVVAQVSATGTTSVAIALPDSNLDDGRVTHVYGTVNGDINAGEYIYKNQILGMGSAANTTGTVSSIALGDDATATITFSGASIGTANDPVYILDGSSAGAGTSEIQGMRAALGTASYAGLARTVSGWSAQIGTTAEALSLSEMELRYLRAKKWAQKNDRYAIFVNITLYKKYGNLLTALRRTVNETDLLGGWTGLEFAAGAGRVGVFLDFDVPDGEAVIVNLDSWTVAEVSPMGWMEEPGTGSMLRLANTITYQAVMVWFTNLLCLAPGANGRLTQKTG